MCVHGTLQRTLPACTSRVRGRRRDVIEAVLALTRITDDEIRAECIRIACVQRWVGAFVHQTLTDTGWLVCAHAFEQTCTRIAY